MSKSQRYKFECAKSEDIPKILELLEEEASPGKISLTYTRRPDPIKSFQKNEGTTDVTVCRDTHSGKIIALWAVSIGKKYIGKRVYDVGYLHSFRIKKGHKKEILLIRSGLKYVFHKTYKNVSLWIISVVEENTMAQRFFLNLPNKIAQFQELGDYNVYALVAKKRRTRNTRYNFQRAKKEDSGALIEFLNKSGMQNEFYPVVTENLLKEKNSVPEWKHFYLLTDSDKNILAAGAAWDQREFKQYLVRKYSGWFKIFRPFSFLFPFFGYPSLCKVGSCLPFLTLSYFAVAENTPDVFVEFIKRFQNEVKKDYPGISYFLIGLHEKNRLNIALKGFPAIKYTSRLFLFEKGVGVVRKMDTSDYYFECGLL